MSTELVPELAVLTDLLLILEDVKTEASAMAGLESADVNLTGVKSADDISDRVETADSVQAGVESADLTYTVPEYAPESEPPRQQQPSPRRTRSWPDFY